MINNNEIIYGIYGLLILVYNIIRYNKIIVLF